MTAQNPITIRVTHRYTASAERVFDAWLDPEHARKWLFTAPEGTVVRAEIDARVGGRFLIVDRRDGKDIAHHGEYREISRPHRLVFTFSVDDLEPADLVTIEIEPQDGGCELTLTHLMAPAWAEWEQSTREGWGMILQGLADHLD